MTGYWYPVTSTIDWCEDNYTHHYYIAEFWNTISNLAYILFGIYGLRSVRSVRSVGGRSSVLSVETRFKVAFASLILVGFGSALFHGTLKWFGQMCDEISMFIASSVVLYIVLEHDHLVPKHKYLPYLLIIFVCGFSCIYIQFQYALLFQSVWILITIYTFVKFYALVKRIDINERKYCYLIIAVFFISAFCWLVEQLLCNHLSIIKYLQLHAFVWHLGTAYVSYSVISQCLHMRNKYVINKKIIHD